jgi:copper chaperone CopZ
MKTTLYIKNLKCVGCETTIIDKLSDLKNISAISIDKKHDAVTFQHKTTQSINEVKKVLLKLGYPPYGERNNLGRKAKSFVSCAIGRLHQDH